MTFTGPGQTTTSRGSADLVGSTAAAADNVTSVVDLTALAVLAGVRVGSATDPGAGAGRSSPTFSAMQRAAASIADPATFGAQFGACGGCTAGVVHAGVAVVTFAAEFLVAAIIGDRSTFGALTGTR